MTSSRAYPVEIISRIAREAGELALSHFERLSTISIESKGHLDLVTAADQAVEQLLTARLREAFPDDGVFGEEGAAVAGRSGRVWVVDPIDGTFNFVRGGDQWMISIGLYERAAPRFGVIYAPVRGQLLSGGEGLQTTMNGKALAVPRAFDESRAMAGVGFHPSIPSSERLDVLRALIEDSRMGFRCCGSATISLLEVAQGRADGYVGMGESTWDVMAALPILHGLGFRDTLDWARLDLKDKLRFGLGSRAFLDAARPALALLGS